MSALEELDLCLAYKDVTEWLPKKRIWNQNYNDKQINSFKTWYFLATTTPTFQDYHIVTTNIKEQKWQYLICLPSHWVTSLISCFKGFEYWQDPASILFIRITLILSNNGKDTAGREIRLSFFSLLSWYCYLGHIGTTMLCSWHC